MIYLSGITHDIKSNTLEATWLQDTPTEIKRIKCHSYSPSQRDMFIEEVGIDLAQRYLDSAGWTPEFCAAFIAEEEKLAAEAQAKADAEAQAAKDAQQAEFDAAVARQVAILEAAKAQVSP